LTFLHLLHVVGGIIMLAVFVKRSFSEEYTKDNTMSVKAGVIFWHFLGGLWIYLLLFLTFIH
jgi:cytochrome c oxidase subunit 3